jgi:hypothetical protein
MQAAAPSCQQTKWSTEKTYDVTILRNLMFAWSYPSFGGTLCMYRCTKSHGIMP